MTLSINDLYTFKMNEYKKIRDLSLEAQYEIIKRGLKEDSPLFEAIRSREVGYLGETCFARLNNDMNFYPKINVFSKNNDCACFDIKASRIKQLNVFTDKNSFSNTLFLPVREIQKYPDRTTISIRILEVADGQLPVGHINGYIVNRNVNIFPIVRRPSGKEAFAIPLDKLCTELSIIQSMYSQFLSEKKRRNG